MTLEEYEKVLEEKRKALLALKTEERKVKIDKELASMQPLSNKKSAEEIFGSDKDKRKEISDKEERAKKSLSINEFLKPAEGERFLVLAVVFEEAVVAVLEEDSAGPLLHQITQMPLLLPLPLRILASSQP